MPKHLTPEQVKEYVDYAFDFLARDYGYVFKIEKNEYVAESANCRIVFTHDRGLISPCIKPINDAAKNLKKFLYRPGYISVVAIAICSDSDFQFIPPNLKEYDPEEDMKISAITFKQYCLKYIRGDFSDWKSIEKCAQGE